MLVPLTILLLSNYILAYDGEARHYYDVEEAEDYFSWFMETYNKTYTKYEAKTRFQIFKNNLKDVNEKNSGLSSPVFGITQFSDLTVEEFVQKYTGFRHNKDLSINPKAILDKDVKTCCDVPEQFDWRDHNLVTKVKAQGHCSASWAFAATGCVEAAYANKTGKLIDLSAQQLIDCGEDSDDCNGGSSLNALMNIHSSGGQETEANYRYTGTKSQCLFDRSKVEAVVTEVDIYSISEEENITVFLYKIGPAVISIDPTSFHQYIGGILKNCTFNNDTLNYAALLVGYGSENDQDYWIIKNSWGETFGEKGYIRIERGVNACGLTEEGLLFAGV